MGALHPSPYRAMIVHPCDLSVKSLLSKGTKGTGEGGSNQDGRQWKKKGGGDAAV